MFIDIAEESIASSFHSEHVSCETSVNIFQKTWLTEVDSNLLAVYFVASFIPIENSKEDFCKFIPRRLLFSAQKKNKYSRLFPHGAYSTKISRIYFLSNDKAFFIPIDIVGLDDLEY
jgi:hypothetical protein